MEFSVPVRTGDLIIIDLRQPVIGRDRAGIAEDQIPDGLLSPVIIHDPPVFYLDIGIYHISEIQKRGLHRTHFFTLFPI